MKSSTICSGLGNSKPSRQRNLAEYEGDIDVDDQLLDALIRVADMIADKLQK